MSYIIQLNVSKDCRPQKFKKYTYQTQKNFISICHADIDFYNRKNAKRVSHRVRKIIINFRIDFI